MKDPMKIFTAILFIGIVLHIFEEDTMAIISTICLSALVIYAKMDSNSKDK